MDAEMSAALTPQALAPAIARDLGLPEPAVVGVLQLLATGAQPVFVSRYRREQVGSLGLRDLERVQAQAVGAVAFELRRQQARAELSALPRFDEEIASLIDSATHPVHFEDPKLLGKKRKRGAAARARGRGLGVLASLLWASGSTGRLQGETEADPEADPLELARQNPGRPPTPRKKKRGGKKKSAAAEASANPDEAKTPADGDPVAEASDDAATSAALADGVDETVEAAEQAPNDATGNEAAPVAADATPGADEQVVAADGAAGSEDAAPVADEAADSDASAEDVTHDASAQVAAENAADESPAVSEAEAVPAADAAQATTENAADDSPAVSEAEAEPAADAAQATDAADEAVSPTADAGEASEAASDDAAEATAEPPRPPSPEQDLASARIIVADDAFHVPVLVRRLRDLVLEQGVLRATRVQGKKDKGGRYARLAERVEPIAKANPSHVLGLLRGEREGALQVHLEIEPEAFDAVCDELLGIDVKRPCGDQLRTALHEAWLGAPGRAVRQSARTLLKRRADRQAIAEFCDAYRPLLLAPALGAKPVVAIEPGFEPGCRVVVLDGAGAIIAQDTVFPLTPKLQAPQAKARIAELAKEHGAAAVCVTNGNGGRDVERMCREAVREAEGLEAAVVSADVDVAGLLGSSRTSKQEFPEADAAVRKAIAAGRRLQNPLAELAKVDPRKLGLGQYQHEVDQEELRAALEQVLVSCINEVGVDLNTASVEQLSRVVGFSHALAQAVVTHRDANGPFATRQALLDVPGVAGKAFEQGAGFVRVSEGEQPLDRTTIHPERYAQVVEIAQDLGVTVGDLVGNKELLDTVDAKRYLGKPGDGGTPMGKPTMSLVLAQLRTPGHDPRPPFEAIEFDPSLEKFEDLTVGMELPGVITHLAKFGAFVDVGIPQEGLVHVSELSHGFISGPSDAVYVGQRVRGRVIEITAERQRFSMSLRALMPKPEGKPGGKRRRRNDDDGPGGRGGKRGRRGDRDGGGRGGGRRGGSDRGGSDRGRRGNKDRGSNDRVLGFRLDLSDLAKQLKD